MFWGRKTEKEKLKTTKTKKKGKLKKENYKRLWTQNVLDINWKGILVSMTDFRFLNKVVLEQIETANAIISQ